MKMVFAVFLLQAFIPGRESVSEGFYLSLKEAEAILGEPAHVADSSSSRKKGITSYYCAYKANSEDNKTGKTGAVYFLFENYAEINSARARYSTSYNANKIHEGVKILEKTGDEAYFHSDGKNFYFIMVRKANRVFNMKVNKITSNTSAEAFNKVGKRIANDL